MSTQLNTLQCHQPSDKIQSINSHKKIAHFANYHAKLKTNSQSTFGCRKLHHKVYPLHEFGAKNKLTIAKSTKEYSSIIGSVAIDIKNDNLEVSQVAIEFNLPTYERELAIKLIYLNLKKIQNIYNLSTIDFKINKPLAKAFSNILKIDLNCLSKSNYIANQDVKDINRLNRELRENNISYTTVFAEYLANRANNLMQDYLYSL